MPSCDGSNCGACSACSVERKTEYIHLDKRERKEYDERIQKLERDLEIQKGINKELIQEIRQSTSNHLER